jgi:hypothetical protein
VEVDDRHIVWLRAQIAGQEPIMRKVAGELVGPHDMDPLAPLIYHAFVLAVRAAFRGGFTYGQVIRVVASIRAMLSPRTDLVDPVAAESEIRRALGDPAAFFRDGKARTTAQMAVLDHLVRDMGLDDDEIFALLRQARQEADRTMAAMSVEREPPAFN